jgi:hypothetical protein
METELPITFEVLGLFEKNDKKSEFLIDKLQAWSNFKTLSNNWYADESNIPHVSITVLPETNFNDKQLDSDREWHINNDNTLMFVYRFDHQTLTCESFIRLDNENIKHVMEQPSQLEPLLQSAITSVLNVIAKEFGCNRI